jgi:hypothetical protein
MARRDQGECSPEQDEAAAVLRPVTRSATDATGSAFGCTLSGGTSQLPVDSPPESPTGPSKVTRGRRTVSPAVA